MWKAISIHKDCVHYADYSIKADLMKKIRALRTNPFPIDASQPIADESKNTSSFSPSTINTEKNPQAVLEISADESSQSSIAALPLKMSAAPTISDVNSSFSDLMSAFKKNAAHYTNLGLLPTASLDEVKAKYETKIESYKKFFEKGGNESEVAFKLRTGIAQKRIDELTAAYQAILHDSNANV